AAASSRGAGLNSEAALLWRWRRPPVRRSLAYLVDHGSEVVDVLEAAVDARKAYVRYLVELLELAHHQFPDAVRVHLALAQVEQLFLDALDGAVDLRGADGPLAQCQVEGAEQLAPVVFDAPAVLL